MGLHELEKFEMTRLQTASKINAFMKKRASKGPAETERVLLDASSPRLRGKAGEAKDVAQANAGPMCLLLTSILAALLLMSFQMHMSLQVQRQLLSKQSCCSAPSGSDTDSPGSPS